MPCVVLEDVVQIENLWVEGKQHAIASPILFWKKEEKREEKREENRKKRREQKKRRKKIILKLGSGGEIQK
jgi:hypothetical protein